MCIRDSFSVAIPITLVELAYAEKRNESWIGNKTLASLIFLLGIVTAIGYFALTPYRPPIIQYMFTIMSVIILIFIAWKTPPKIGKKGKLPPPKPLKLAAIGFLFTLSLFMLFMAGPYLVPQPPALVLGIILVYAMARFLGRYTWNNKTLYHKFALAAGALSFLIALTPIQEFDTSRMDNPRGMLIVGIAAIIMLLLLARKLKKELFSKAI